MSELGFTIGLEQMEHIQAALGAISRHVRELAAEGGHDRTVAVIGTNLAEIQMNLIAPPERTPEADED